VVGFGTCRVVIYRDRTRPFRMVHAANPWCYAQLREAAADVHRRPKKRSGRVLYTKQTLMTFLAC